METKVIANQSPGNASIFPHSHEESARFSGPTFLSPPVKPANASTTSQSWRWLGTLRRSLTYGSQDFHETKVEWDGDTARHVGEWPALSDEDRETLDAVFGLPGTTKAKEAERMRSVLVELADRLGECQDRAAAAPKFNRHCGRGGSVGSVGWEEKKDSSDPPAPSSFSDHPIPDADRMTALLLDVRGLCHNRPDFSRAFVAMGGLDVLLGCASERGAVPRETRSACFLVLTSLAYLDPFVQLRLLNKGAVRLMTDLYFAEYPPLEGAKEDKFVGAGEHPEPDDNGAVRSRIVQAIDAAVCGHSVAERRFCSSERGRRVVEVGMGVISWNHNPIRPPAALRKRCLSLLNELVSSRFTSQERVESFSSALRHVATKMTVPKHEEDERIRELALGSVLKMLRQKNKGSSVILGLKAELKILGEKRMEEVRSMDAVERRVTGDAEQDLWFRIETELERA